MFCKALILIALEGPGGAVGQYLVKARTENVDVDSAGRKVRGRAVGGCRIAASHTAASQRLAAKRASRRLGQMRLHARTQKPGLFQVTTPRVADHPLWPQCRERMMDILEDSWAGGSGCGDGGANSHGGVAGRGAPGGCDAGGAAEASGTSRAGGLRFADFRELDAGSYREAAEALGCEEAQVLAYAGLTARRGAA